MPKKQNNIQALSKKIVYDRLSEAAQGVFDNIKKTTKNFTKDDEKSEELFMKFYNSLVERKPLAVRGTDEFRKEENRVRVQKHRNKQKAAKRRHPANTGTGSERDAARVGKRPGWRLPNSNRIPTNKQKRDGTAYFEDRIDRSDVNRKSMPYLKDGGEIGENEMFAKGGEVEGNLSSIRSAIKKAVENESDKATIDSGNIRVDMVYEYGDLRLNFYFKDFNNPKFEPSIEHYGTYEAQNNGSIMSGDFKAYDAVIYDKQGKKHNADKLIEKTINVLKELGYEVAEFPPQDLDDDTKFAKGGEIGGVNPDDYVLEPNPEYKYQNILKKWLIDANPEKLEYKIAVLLLLDEHSPDKLVGLDINENQEGNNANYLKYGRILRFLCSIGDNKHEMAFRTRNFTIRGAEIWAKEALSEQFKVIKKPANYTYYYDKDAYADGGEIGSGDLITFNSMINGECKGYISDWNINSTTKNKEIAYIVTRDQMNSDKFVVCSGIVRDDNYISHTVREVAKKYDTEAEALEIARKMAESKEFAEDNAEKFAKGGKVNKTHDEKMQKLQIEAIAYLTGLSEKMLPEWISDNNINQEKLFGDIVIKKLDPQDLVTAIVGTPNNKIFKEIKSKYSNSTEMNNNDKYKEGGKLTDNATYVPNRDIKQLSIVLKGVLTTVKGSDVLDGVYLKKYKKGTPSKIKWTAASIYNNILQICNSNKSFMNDSNGLKNFKKEDVKKLMDAGYDYDDIIMICLDYSYFKYGRIEGLIKSENNREYNNELKLYIDNAKDKTFEIGLDYPNCNWKNIIKKYGITAENEKVDKKFDYGKGNYDIYTYQIFKGKNIVFGCTVGRKVYKNNKLDKVDDYYDGYKITSLSEPSPYQKQNEFKAGFNGSYWGAVSSKKEVIYDIVKMLIADEDNDWKGIDVYINQYGGIHPQELIDNNIKFEKGGRMPSGSVDGRLNKKIKEMMDFKFSEFLEANKFNKNALLYFTNIATNSALIDSNFTFTKELNEIFKTSSPIKIRDNDDDNKEKIEQYTKFISDFGKEIAETAKWDADDIVNGVSYFLSMNGLRRYAEQLESLKLKYSKGGLTKKRTYKAIMADKNLKALHGGKRTSEDGNTYYEYRDNHSDVNRTKKYKTGGKVDEWYTDEHWKNAPLHYVETAAIYYGNKKTAWNKKETTMSKKEVKDLVHVQTMINKYFPQFNHYLNKHAKKFAQGGIIQKTHRLNLKK